MIAIANVNLPENIASNYLIEKMIVKKIMFLSALFLLSSNTNAAVSDDFCSFGEALSPSAGRYQRSFSFPAVRKLKVVLASELSSLTGGTSTEGKKFDNVVNETMQLYKGKSVFRSASDIKKLGTETRKNLMALVQLRISWRSGLNSKSNAARERLIHLLGTTLDENGNEDADAKKASEEMLEGIRNGYEQSTRGTMPLDKSLEL